MPVCVAHISSCEGNPIRQLMLKGDVVLIYRGQRDRGWPELGIDARRQRERSIGADLHRLNGGWTLGQRKHARKAVWRLNALVGKDGRILRHVVPKVGTEYAEVVGPPITCANHSFRVDLVGDANSRREMVPVHGLDAMR